MCYTKEEINAANKKKKNLTTSQLIALLNTPYSSMPEDYKPGMTQNPQKFQFIQIHKPHIGEQNDTFGARLLRYRRKYHLNREQFCNVCNEYVAMHNSKKSPVRTRITLLDIENYELRNVSPKIDKMTVISKATGMPLDYFAGYGPKYRRTKG